MKDPMPEEIEIVAKVLFDEYGSDLCARPDQFHGTAKELIEALPCRHYFLDFVDPEECVLCGDHVAYDYIAYNTSSS